LKKEILMKLNWIMRRERGKKKKKLTAAMVA
jgi:hypothetical protein